MDPWQAWTTTLIGAMAGILLGWVIGSLAGLPNDESGGAADEQN